MRYTRIFLFRYRSDSLYTRSLIQRGHLHFFILLCLFISYQGLGQEQPQYEDPIRIIKNTATELVVQYRPSVLRLDTISTGTRMFIKPVIDQHTSISAPGEIDIPVYVLPLLTPNTAPFRIEILSREEKRLFTGYPAPTPLESTTGEAPVYRISDTYQKGVRADIVFQNDPVTVRGRIERQVCIAPFRVNMETGTHSLISSLILRITYPGADIREQTATLFQPFSSHSLPSSKDDGFFSHYVNYRSLPVPQSGSLIQPRESVLRTGQFYKLELRQSGVYRLDRAYLQGLGIQVSAIDPRRIKIYSNGGQELPVSMSIPRPTDLIEIPILVRGESDGRFDDGDAVLFYAEGPNGLLRTGNELGHYLNRQTESSFVFLTAEGVIGKRVESQASATGTPIATPESFQNLSFVENDRINFSNTSHNFYDRPLTATSTRLTYTLPTPGIDLTRNVTYRFRGISRTAQTESLILSENGRQLRVLSLFRPPGFFQIASSVFTTATVDASRITGESTRFEMDFSVGNSASLFYPDWAEVLYWQRLEAINGTLLFNSLVGASTSGIIEYAIRNSGANPIVWNITTLSSIRQVTPLTEASNTVVFRAAETLGSQSVYLCFPSDGPFLRPQSGAAVPNQNLQGLALRSGSSYPDYIVIYGRDFQSDARRLADYRSNTSLWGNLARRSVSVSVDAIFNEFSGGRQDFTAIRDFIKYLYDAAPDASQRPTHVVLFGDGDWDFRNILGGGYSKVPTHQTDENLFSYTNQVQSTDDFFVAVDGLDIRPDLAIGRITVQRASEARVVVDKIIDYESRSDPGDWQTRSIFVADDGPNGSGENDGARFCFDSESTITQMQVSASYMTPVKLYSGFFRFERATGGLRRPDAFNEIIRQLNLGALVTNFIGHGNPTVWTAERIFEPSFSLPLLFNRKRMTLCVTATCDFGRADDPNSQSGGEAMFLLPDGGAIALITNSRSILISSGSTYPPILFRILFERNPEGRYYTLGESLIRFKSRLSSFGFFTDIEKFFLLGDPGLRLLGGGKSVWLDSINQQSTAQSVPLVLPALGKARFDGVVHSGDSLRNMDFQGNASLVVYDTPTIRGADNNAVGTFDTFFEVQNSVIFRGTVRVTNGRLALNFIIPRNINYDSLRNGRVTVSAWADDHASGSLGNPLRVTAQGVLRNIAFFGTNPNALVDTEGPKVDVYLNDAGFVSGSLTHPNPVLKARIFDESGINLTQRVGQEITLVLNGNTQNPIILNEFFQSLPESFTEGELRYPFQNLEDGSYEATLKIWDTFNNSTDVSLNFSVQSSSSPSLRSVYNFPNPFRDRTTFFFTHNAPPGRTLETTIRIFTVAGRLIHTIQETAFSEGGPIRLPWDGRDKDGDLLANGVYLYKVSLRDPMGGFATEKVEKLVILR